MKKLVIFMAAMILNLSLFANVPLKRGTIVPVRTGNDISSKANGTSNVAYVDADVRDDDGKILISRGTPVELSVTSKKAKGMGKAGKVTIACISTTAVDGQRIQLSGPTMSHEGDSKKGVALGCGLGLGLTFLPVVGFAFFAIKGEEANIPANSVLTNILVASDYKISESK